MGVLPKNGYVLPYAEKSPETQSEPADTRERLAVSSCHMHIRYYTFFLHDSIRWSVDVVPGFWISDTIYWKSTLLPWV